MYSRDVSHTVFHPAQETIMVKALVPGSQLKKITDVRECVTEIRTSTTKKITDLVWTFYKIFMNK